MGGKLPEKAHELLEKPILAHVATVMENGSPQITPVWVDTDGQHIIFNTLEGRVKVRNMRRDPSVAISIVDPADPFMGSLQVRGRVIEITTDGADDHIDRLARKYTGADRYANRQPGEVRLIVKIEPERVSGGITLG